MAITLQIEGFELLDDDNVLIIKPGPDSERFAYEFLGFKDLKFKPDRLTKENIKYILVVYEGIILSCHRISNPIITFDINKGLITKLEAEEINLIYKNKMVKGKKIDYKTGVATTAFNVKKLFEREILT